jgi:peptide/nickel transport system substrate-binding protein
MNRLFRYGVLAAALALIVALVVPLAAQEVTPGEGGIIIEGNFGGDPATFNPLLASDTSSARVAGFMFPAWVGVNPETGVFEPGRPDALVTDWSISEDGLTYTFTLRDDWTWSDGTPITSADIIYSWNAIASGLVESSLTYQVDLIESASAPDPQTIIVTFKAAACTNLTEASFWSVVPAHVLPADFAEVNDADFNLNPTVTGGVFNFGEFRAGEQVSLIANQTYGGASEGVLPTGYIYKVVPDQTVLVEQFIAGETNVIDGPAVARRADLIADANIQPYQFPGNAWDYLALNYADPANPQNATDDAGAALDQGHHPLFGDVRVRQAISLGIDVESIIEGAVFGFGTRMPSLTIPASWAFDSSLAPIPFDVDAAAALLDEAGFVDDDNDPTTPRVAQGAMYADDGTPLQFTLYTNEGNSRRGAIGTIVQDQLRQLGIVVDFQAIDFNTLLDIMDAQTFDAVILGWRNGFPDDPDQTGLFTPAGDVVGGGNNITSYNNARVTELMEQARVLPGCDNGARAEIYHEIQAILQQELPYVPLFAIEGMYAARTSVGGFSPFPSQLFWNVDRWTVASS